MTTKNANHPNGITGSSSQAADISQMAAEELTTPRPTKLPEGWHFTKKYGEVFVSPGGVAWAVQLIGDELCSVSVKLSKDDIVQKPSAERVKRNLVDRQRRKSRVVDVSPPIFTPSVVSKANDGVVHN